MSLVGKRVVVTRAIHQAGELADMLRERGAIPVMYPCIDITPADDLQSYQVLNQTAPFDWVIVTSPNTVYALSRAGGIPDGVKVAAVGVATAETVREYLQCEADFVPEKQLGAVLGETLPLNGGARIFLPQSGRADGTLADILEGRGAEVVVTTAYENVIGEGGEDLTALLKQGEIDAITFTSGSTVENLTRRLGYTPAQIPAVCIGSSTAGVAQGYHYETVIYPTDDYSLKGLMDALIYFFDTN